MLHRSTTPSTTHGLHAHGGTKNGLLLFVLLIAQLMVILDITAVNIALPRALASRTSAWRSRRWPTSRSSRSTRPRLPW